ncbi:MAG TPA: magnesium transporter [Gammaproteobacteria bacterium]
MRNDNNSSAARLTANLAQVVELLEIFHREEAQRAAGDPDQPKPAVHNTLPDLRDRLSRMHLADVAVLLESLPHEDRLLLWRQLREQRGGELLVALGESVRVTLMARLSEEELRLAIGQLDSDGLAAIANVLPPPLLRERLLALPEAERHWLERSMAYRADAVGKLMSRAMVAVPDHLTLEQVRATLRNLGELPPHTDTIFVIDRQGVLRGGVPLPALLLSASTLAVSDVMRSDIVTFTAEEEARGAAQAFARYALVSAPVVDRHGKLLGRLTVDGVMDLLRNERAVLNLAGLRGEEELFASLWSSARNRWLWLAITLLTALVASRVIGLFETTIAQRVALAALMPIVASIGGHSGNQATARVLRALARDQLTIGNSFYLLRKELQVGLLNGVVCAAVAGGFAYAIYGQMALASVIAAAMVLTVLLAALVGVAVPLVRRGREPALGSTTLLTAATSTMGFFIFLGLASLFLL